MSEPTAAAPRTGHHEERAARALVGRVWNELDAAAADQLVAADCPGRGGTGPRAVLSWHEERRTSFSDLRYEVTDLVASPGRAVVRWQATGHQDGPFGTMPATGRPVSYAGATFLTFDAAGLVREVWSVNELFGLLLQIGAEVVPPAG